MPHAPVRARALRIGQAVRVTDAATLTVRTVSKHLGENHVLDGISLDLLPGRITVLLGPSGCGKSTLLRLIAGLDAVDSGTIDCDGKTISSPDATLAPRHRRIGLVFQDGVLFDHLSVGDNVGYGLAARGEAAARRVAELLELVDLGGTQRRAPTTMSGGQRQRVALARALGPAPRVLLLDEPFANLDAILRRSLRRQVKQLLAGTDTTVLFVTHDREEAFSLADRVALMNGGAIVQVGEPQALYERPATPWAAEFFGPANWVTRSDLVLLRGSARTNSAGIGTSQAEGDGGTHNASGDRMLVRPHQLTVTAGGDATVESVTTVGAYSTMTCAHPGLGHLDIDVVGPAPFRCGDSVSVALTVDPASLAAFPSPVR